MIDLSKIISIVKASLTASFQPAQSVASVASLPASASEGDIGFATDGRKSGEGAGLGTGVPVYYSGGSWRVYSSDAAVAS